MPLNIIDGGSKSDWAGLPGNTFPITVTSLNDHLLVEPIPDIYISENDEFLYQIIINDPDDTDFSFELDNQPEGMIVSNSGLISWLVTEPGTFGPITITITDGGEDGTVPVLLSFIITVEESSPYITMEFDFQHGSNLISFQGIPEDSSVASVLAPLDENALALIGQSTASAQISNGLWAVGAYLRSNAAWSTPGFA